VARKPESLGRGPRRNGDIAERHIVIALAHPLTGRRVQAAQSDIEALKPTSDSADLSLTAFCLLTTMQPISVGEDGAAPCAR